MHARGFINMNSRSDVTFFAFNDIKCQCHKGRRTEINKMRISFILETAWRERHEPVAIFHLAIDFVARFRVTWISQNAASAERSWRKCSAAFVL